jgi:hypothetical protein
LQVVGFVYFNQTKKKGNWEGHKIQCSLGRRHHFAKLDFGGPTIQVLDFDKEDKEDNSSIFNKAKYGHEGKWVKSVFASQPHRPQQSPTNVIRSWSI